MRWLLVFLCGVLVGVGGVYVLKRYEPAPEVPVAVPLPAQPTASPSVAVPEPPVEPVPPVTVAAPPEPSTAAQAPVLSVPGLLVPIAGIRRDQLNDTFDQARAGHKHEAIDIMAPRGTPVLAVADGKVIKLFHSKPGGLTVYQFDTTEKLAYYYAHLDGYAPGMAEGKVLKRGDLVGYVGSTGNADPGAPHLHFAIFELGPEKQWWKGKAVNPYPLLVDQ
jgi:peptidoglycan LD-endopeptidase LytH